MNGSNVEQMKAEKIVDRDSVEKGRQTEAVIKKTQYTFKTSSKLKVFSSNSDLRCSFNHITFIFANRSDSKARSRPLGLDRAHSF